MKVYTIKEWLRDKIDEEAKSYHMLLDGCYSFDTDNHVDGSISLNHSTILVEEVVSETEKAVKVQLSATTFGGHYHAFTAWLPKSQIISNDADASVYHHPINGRTLMI